MFPQSLVNFGPQTARTNAMHGSQGDHQIATASRCYASNSVAAERVWNSLPTDIKDSTGRRQHLSNVVLKLFYLTGASLNICK